MDLPFDKLPKFLAIAGLSLAIAGATLACSTFITREQALENKALKAENDRLWAKVRELMLKTGEL
jgi:hypothetical protein